ncbi:breast cancer anti-estrogen resistance protein 1 [Stomoxys calcitrans]|uniref:breast cancer anti-estrogen resistance protein 1 n=1 Tax=Stomoxys calcitrans TaxID=35570 RepID=UPI0027E315EF|nr:breast cancer anti-estrogen resistance protein 1 [Stomoxys calcitrans]XP_059226774.1 breast cancer anti-estrogen resistance protein 1 [Stomoxys calcitrans]XP_059226775.1 breast cancer anti-estrogen resistance protein 1 [Stomoxys calcitrans]XP_059226776.1 breast cancer anti-estrogen resistance protein 1 [Stomoxys calcitrans]XP_059226777.1 breast cancer anti-estrogen resistance protein 1 [Stomoxys calcitrans]
MLDKTSEYCSLDYDVPVTRPIKIIKKLQAKALYDNAADSPDELPFRKGDILEVLEQDTEGLTGWWLCRLRGRKGLCPGNRLRFVNSYDSGCFSPSPSSSPCPSLAASTATLNSSICSADIYENTSIISGSGSSGISSNSSGSGNGSNCGISVSQTQLNTTSATTNMLQQQQQHQRHGTRRSWHVSPNKVITPQRHGDVYIYNIPPQQQQHQAQSHNSQHLLSAAFAQQELQQQQIYQNLPGHSVSHEFETYDIPKPAVPINYDIPRYIKRNMAHLHAAAKKACSTPIPDENYDVPRPLNSLLQHQHTLTPSSSNSSLLTNDSLSLSFSSSNRSSLANMPDYDIPRRNPLPVRAVLQQQQQQQQQQQRPSSRASSVNGNCSTYDFPIPTNGLDKKGAGQAVVATKELPLELSSALETLAKLQSETTMAITRLLAFVSPEWRCREKLEPVLMEVKLAAVRLRTALHDLAEFGEGALGNASKSEDRTLATKLKPIIRALRDANNLVQDSCEVLEANGGWSMDLLVRDDDKNTCKSPDSLDRLIACAQTLTEDVRSTTSFIQGNASLLFKRQLSEVIEESSVAANQTTSVPQTPTAEEERTTAVLLEDYDYVSFESKDAAARKNSLLREAIPENMKNKFDTVLKVAENTVLTTASNNMPATPNGKKVVVEMNEKDKMLVRYYAVQITTHMGNLGQAIDSFLETVKNNQPPKFFIAYGKFVVVSAHNLVTIGDIVHRNVSKADLKEKILRCSNNLAEALKTCVLKSKQAAAYFPSVTAVQEMVDSVVDISHLACALKTVMLHAHQLTM